MARVARVWLQIRRLARGVDSSRPWASNSAADLDRHSVAAWLGSLGLSGRALTLIRSLLEGFATVPLERLSLLHLLWWARRGGLLGIARWRVSGGAQRLAEALAARLRDPIGLGIRVDAIEQSSSAVCVYAGGREFRAANVVVSVPLPSLVHIRFAPALADLHRGAVSHLRFGQASTIVVLSASRLDQGRVAAAIGEVEPGLAWRRGRVLKSLALTASARPSVSSLTELFGAPNRGMAAESVDWGADRSFGGTYLAPGPGELTTWGPALGLSASRLQFAAAERSGWPDSMEGALESGEAAACRLLTQRDSLARFP